MTDKINALLVDQQAYATILNALTRHVRYCHRRAMAASTDTHRYRWANECKIAMEMRPGFLDKATAAKAALDEAIREERDCEQHPQM